MLPEGKCQWELRFFSYLVNMFHLPSSERQAVHLYRHLSQRVAPVRGVSPAFLTAACWVGVAAVPVMGKTWR